MLSFDWYTEVSHTKPLTQGDIFFEFPVPIIDESKAYPFFKPKWTKKDVIVITQACDIEQGKVNEITFCPIIPVEEMVIDLMREETIKSRDNQWRKNGKGVEDLITFDFNQPSIMKKALKKINELRKGAYLPLHLLNETDVKTQHFNIGSKVVLLRDTYQLPIKSALELVQSPEIYPHRLRLLPPYREHLAQAYATVFMRIGLPQDIKPEKLQLKFPTEIVEFDYKKPKMED